MKDDEPILKLVRISSATPNTLDEKESTAKALRQSGSARGMISMSDDFDEPLDDFSEYMQ